MGCGAEKEKPTSPRGGETKLMSMRGVTVFLLIDIGMFWELESKLMFMRGITEFFLVGIGMFWALESVCSISFWLRVDEDDEEAEEVVLGGVGIDRASDAEEAVFFFGRERVVWVAGSSVISMASSLSFISMSSNRVDFRAPGSWARVSSTLFSRPSVKVGNVKVGEGIGVEGIEAVGAGVDAVQAGGMLMSGGGSAPTWLSRPSGVVDGEGIEGGIEAERTGAGVDVVWRAGVSLSGGDRQRNRFWVGVGEPRERLDQLLDVVDA